MSVSGPQTIVTSAARIATGASAAIVGPTTFLAKAGSTLNLFLNVTAQSGTTPTLDVTIEWSADGGTTWAKTETPDTFAQNTGVVQAVCKQFAAKSSCYRVVWTLGGTDPSFTFSVSEFVS